MIWHCKVYKEDKESKLIGMFGADERGDIAYIGNESLIKPLEALFGRTKSFFVIKRNERGSERVEIMPIDQERWMEEFRRQVPTPYWGGPVDFFHGRLEELTNLWRSINGDSTDHQFRRF